MYGYANMPPPWMWPPGPSTPSSPPQDPVQMITQWQQSLDALKKAFKEEKKEEKKPDKGFTPSIWGTALFMLLISPITGPMMFSYFQASLRLIK